MAEITSLIDTLKRALKTHGLTYVNVADALELSVASVKRMFALRHFTLQRLETICQMMDMGIVDLVQLLDEQRKRISHLTFEQEKELVNNHELLLVALCVQNYWTFDDIIQNYTISETECIRLLARLDHLQLIELLPNNRIKLLVAHDFRWLPTGPIEQFFDQKVLSEFLQSDFNHEDEFRFYLNGTLSRNSMVLLSNKLQRLRAEFTELQIEDAAQPLAERCNIGLVVAMRPWEFSAFEAMRRE